MTKVTDVLNRAARECSVTAPSSWITATNTTVKELRDDFLLEAVDELQQRIDWASPVGKTQTISGDGSESYSLNSNFIRLTRDQYAVYETANVRRFAVPVTTDGEWEYLSDIGTGAGSRFYKIEGYEGNFTISLYPNPASGESLTVSYVSDVWKKSSGGTEGNTFSDADDVVLYPRRLLELGIVWRFRKRKGLPYADVLAEYEARVARASNNNRGTTRIDFGGGSRPRTPYDIPVPDFIPAS